MAVQAIRAHADSEAGRDAIAAAISARFHELSANAALAHVEMEGVRALFPDAARPSAQEAFDALVRAVPASPRLPALTRGHILCLARAGQVRGMSEPEYAPLQRCGRGLVGRRVLWQVTTTRGEVLIELQPDLAPWTVAAIAMLTQRGFHDGLAFHRVVPDFFVHGAAPTESGYGGAGFLLPTEPSLAADGGGFRRGAVGLADAGKDSGGSQWFGMHSRAAYQDDRYTRIGRVERGQDALEALLVGDQIVRARLE